MGTSLRADYISVTLTSFPRSHEDLNGIWLYPQYYLLNQWVEFHQTCMYMSLGLVWLVSRQNESFIPGGSFVKTMCWVSYFRFDGWPIGLHWNNLKSWLDFGTLTSFSKSQLTLEDVNIYVKCSLYPQYLLNQWVEFYQTCMDTLLGPA